ncbi:MAG: transcription antitermination factor NusB [Eubacteriales bacterium]
MGRKAAREILMKVFYVYEVTGEFSFDIPDIIQDETKSNSYEDQKDYIENAMSIFIEKKDEIDKLISDNTIDWSIDRLSKVDLSIIRLAVCEMFYLNVPVKVAINEAVLLAKKYSSENAHTFINGVLGGCAKALIDENEVLGN